MDDLHDIAVAYEEAAEHYQAQIDELQLEKESALKHKKYSAVREINMRLKRLRIIKEECLEYAHFCRSYSTLSQKTYPYFRGF